MKLEGRHAIVTGASMGLGAEIARHFVDEGASVLVCARSERSLAGTCEELKRRMRPAQALRAVRCDVSDARQVDRMVEEALAAFGKIDVLVNNAGVYGPLGRLEEVSWTDWVSAIEINLLGTVYPCRAVLPHFRARRYGKIINLSGGGATNALPRVSAYAASKAAVVLFTETLALEVAEDRIDVNAVAPGALKTRLTEELLAAGPERVGAAFHERMRKLSDEGGTPLSKGAELCVYLASAESDGITGKLLSAVWDPWRDLAGRRKDLEGTDVYTLRRIVPKDRGLSWGND